MYFVENLISDYGVQNSGFYKFVDDYHHVVTQACSGVGGKHALVY